MTDIRPNLTSYVLKAPINTTSDGTFLSVVCENPQKSVVGQNLEGPHTPSPPRNYPPVFNISNYEVTKQKHIKLHISSIPFDIFIFYIVQKYYLMVLLFYSLNKYKRESETNFFKAILYLKVEISAQVSKQLWL